MQLYLVNNNPISTQLVRSDGQPLFSIQTPTHPPTHGRIPSASGSMDDTSTLAMAGQDSPATTILRLGRRKETIVGVVDYCGPSIGTSVKLCEDDLEITIAPCSREAITGTEYEDEDSPADWSVFFLGVIPKPS
jgi:hypothetical protein